ncbi:hypothetical protein GQ42DRAFT_161921 [Ramicandelaber brevisporus]|nr:hypothetical protein GQ42DRAFT_161921 [Ramicandelaber brevisporus]
MKRGPSSPLASAFDTDTKRSKPSDTIPIRLTSLPFELLEHVASFFRQPEAARLLSVNSSFHDAFSRVVWRYLRYDERTIKRIIPSAWRRYGYLIRSVEIARPVEIAMSDHDEDRPERERLVVPNYVEFPNIVRLSLLLNDSTSTIFETAPLEKLRNLHVVMSVHETWSLAEVQKVAGWISSAKKRGQRVVVDWHVDWYVDYIFMTVESTLTELDAIDLHSLTFSNDFGEPWYRHILGDNHNIIYGSVKTLAVKIENIEYDDEFTTITPSISPSQFPSVSRVCVQLDRDYEMAVNEQLFDGKWNSVKELEFVDTDHWGLFNVTINRFPNLERLTLANCGFDVDMHLIIKHCPNLKYLALINMEIMEYGRDSDDKSDDGGNDGSYDKQQQQPQLVNLNQLILYSEDKSDALVITEDHFWFIFNACPNLETLELANCIDLNQVIDENEGRINDSVRSLKVSCGYSGFQEHEIGQLVVMFPNLTTLTIANTNDDKVKKLYEAHSNIRVLRC